ncbi:MAG: APC family permease [Candidatus Binatia bacterium]
MRKIGTFTATCVLISTVIGSGIFTTTGFMARDLGNPTLILFLWALGGFLALAGALSYSELGAALPEVGGEYVYLRRAYHPYIGFLSGWTSFTVGFGAAIAATAASFVSYFLQVFPLGSETSLTAQLLALGLVWILTSVHLAGVGSSERLQRILTTLKVGAIFLLVGGAVTIGEGNWNNVRVTAEPTAASTGTVFVSLIFVMYAYSGWNAAAYIAGEMKDPQRSIPRTMIWGTLFVGAVYLTLNLIYLYALPVTALGQEPVLPVAEKAAVQLFGPIAARLIAALLCLSLAGGVSAMVWAGPRVYYAMARDGVFPAFFADTNGADLTPKKAIVMQSVWVSLLLLSGTFEQLVIFSGFSLTIFGTLAVSAVITLRWREPSLRRPYRVPFYPLVPLAYIILSLMIVAYTTRERPTEALLASATILGGTPVFLLLRPRSET